MIVVYIYKYGKGYVIINDSDKNRFPDTFCLFLFGFANEPSSLPSERNRCYETIENCFLLSQTSDQAHPLPVIVPVIVTASFSLR